MPAEAHLSSPALTGFLVTLARFGSLAVFVPIPGMKAAPQAARVLLAVSLTIAMAPAWPSVKLTSTAFGGVVLLLVEELLFGLAMGLVVGFLSEVLVFGVQSIALQAGFSYASSIDPTSEADSGVLQVIAQLGANLLFFSAGMDHVVVRAFARSLETWPPGAMHAGWPAAQAIIALGGTMLELGFRLALPVAALLLLADLTLALLSRIQAQLQLLSLAFPLKMLGTLAAFAALVPLVPVIYRSGISRALHAMESLVR